MKYDKSALLNEKQRHKCDASPSYRNNESTKIEECLSAMWIFWVNWDNFKSHIMIDDSQSSWL